MRLHSLRLHPFGRFSDQTVSFAPGLNVVLGPNEAGKSTLFRAVRTVLFEPSRLGKLRLNEIAGQLFPVGGGDHAAVEAILEARDGRYALRRRWGASPSAELTLPGGASVSEERTIGERMKRILPAAEGSFRAVLLAGQAELAGTVAGLQNEEGTAARDELSAVLRKAVQETGGVSVERFRRSLEKRITAAYGRWDMVRGLPEGGRGHKNRWEKGVGEVLAAHYAVEESRAALDAASLFDRGLDDANRGIAEAERALEDGRKFLAGHERTYRDARERGKMESDLRAAKADLDALQKDQAEWVVSLQKEKELAPAIRELEKRQESLQKEMREADAAEKAKGLREKAARAFALSDRLIAAQGKLAAAPRLDRERMEEIRQTASDVDSLQRELKSGRLAVQIRTRAAVHLEIREDLNASEGLDLGSEELRTFDAAWRFGIRHPDFDVSVKMLGDKEKAGKDLKEKSARLADLLTACGCADVKAAGSAHRLWEDLKAEAERARRNLADELGAEAEEALRVRVAALGPASTSRPLAEVASEAARAESELKQARADLERLRGRIGELKAGHQDPERLLLALAKAAQGEKSCRDALAAGAPLPEGYADAAMFLEAYEKAQGKARDTEAALSGLRARKEALLERAPESSAEELAGELAAREERFAAVLSRGKALLRVRDAAERLSAGGEDAVFGGLHDETARLFSAMTGGRWASLDMEGGLPAAARAGDGTPMPRDLLSAGAADALALALRLAMAAKLLGGQDGFLMMDDPLVDLDPVRQEAAAAEIRAFAAKHQTVILTCHPRHAEILGGSRIGLP